MSEERETDQLPSHLEHSTAAACFGVYGDKNGRAMRPTENTPGIAIPGVFEPLLGAG